MPVGMPSPPRGGRRKPRSRAKLGTGGARRADNAIRGINICVKAMYRGLLKKSVMCNTGAKISRSARQICFFRGQILLDTFLMWGVGPILQERLVARRVRPD
jgi:hypothetical protein